MRGTQLVVVPAQYSLGRDDGDFYSPPERAKPKTERERRRRVVRVRPVVIRPRVVRGIRPVVRAIITAVVAARTEIGGVGFARRLGFRLRRRRARRHRSRSAKRQYGRDSGRSNQRLHGSSSLHLTKKQVRLPANLPNLTRLALFSPAAPVAAMVPAVVAVMTMPAPAHLGGARHLLGAFLHRSSSARVTQRQRQRALGRDSECEQR